MTFEPAGTGSGLSVLVIAMSALELMVVVCVTLLLAGVGSVVEFDALTVAVLEMLPLLPAGTLSVIWYCEFWPLVIAGSVQLKVPPVWPTVGCVQVPASLPYTTLSQSKVGPVGSTSFSTTL